MRLRQVTTDSLKLELYKVDDGLNTAGWAAGKNGGDHDYNDLIVGIDFTSGASHQLVACRSRRAAPTLRQPADRLILGNLAIDCLIFAVTLRPPCGLEKPQFLGAGMRPIRTELGEPSLACAALPSSRYPAPAKGAYPWSR